MKVAIFGSCVSRDTCEYMPESEVLTYVARHSVTSLDRPHGPEHVDLTELTSPFQRRMVTGDLKGNGLSRITKNADKFDLVLIDLVDERLGYWLFADGTTMTNSMEVASCGAAREARRAGARLIEFGTDEHFERWRAGFSTLMNGLKESGLWDRTILLDIEWARALDGAQHPSDDWIAKLGRQWRKLQRGTREAARSVSKGLGVSTVWRSLRAVKPTEAEEFADKGATANRELVRYRDVARSLSASAVVRTSGEVRIGREHRWGPQPFHYRESDYRSIVASIQERVSSRAKGQD